MTKEFIIGFIFGVLATIIYYYIVLFFNNKFLNIKGIRVRKYFHEEYDLIFHKREECFCVTRKNGIIVANWDLKIVLGNYKNKFSEGES